MHVRGRFSWKGLKKDVMRHISECVTCQQNKSEQTLPAGLLQPFPTLEQKWKSISMDFITGLPKAQGKDCIFVVVDRLTKFAHFFHDSYILQCSAGGKVVLQTSRVAIEYSQ
jgi:hypothetical protein